MKSALILLSFLFLSFFELIISTRNLSGNEEYSSLDDTLKYYKYSGEKLKKLLKDENIYVIDTRSFEKSAAGYIPNTILCPLSMLSFLYSVVEVGSEVIIITEIEEKQKVIDEFIELFAYKLLGYSIFSEVNMTFPTNEVAQIIANSLNDYKEYCEEITRQIKAEGRILNIIYTFEYEYIKNLKKSLLALYENIKLVVLTIKDFSPKV